MIKCCICGLDATTGSLIRVEGEMVLPIIDRRYPVSFTGLEACELCSDFYPKLISPVTIKQFIKEKQRICRMTQKEPEPGDFVINDTSNAIGIVTSLSKKGTASSFVIGHPYINVKVMTDRYGTMYIGRRTWSTGNCKIINREEALSLCPDLSEVL